MYGFVPTTPPTIVFTNLGTSAKTSTRSSLLPREPATSALTSLPSFVLPLHEKLTAAGSGQALSGSPLTSVWVVELLDPAQMISPSRAIPPTLTTVDPYDGGVVYSIITAEYVGAWKLTKFHLAAVITREHRWHQICLPARDLTGVMWLHAL